MGEQLGGLLDHGLGLIAPTADEESTGDHTKVVDDVQKLRARGLHDRFSHRSASPLRRNKRTGAEPTDERGIPPQPKCIYQRLKG